MTLAWTPLLLFVGYLLALPILTAIHHRINIFAVLIGLPVLAFSVFLTGEVVWHLIAALL